MIYTKDWCVLHIPRTSGTNFKHNAIMKYNNSVKLPFSGSSVESRLGQHNPLSFFELSDQTKVYAIVRHPYTRALSLYNYAMNDDAFKSIIGTPSFEEFWDIDLSSYCEWSLRTNQTEFIKHNSIKVKTFKMEEPLRELYKLTKVIYYKKGINKSVSSPKEYDKPKNKAIIEKIFKEDYHVFGYE